MMNKTRKIIKRKPPGPQISSSDPDQEYVCDNEESRILRAERFCLLEEVTNKDKKIASLESQLYSLTRNKKTVAKFKDNIGTKLETSENQNISDPNVIVDEPTVKVLVTKQKTKKVSRKLVKQKTYQLDRDHEGKPELYESEQHGDDLMSKENMVDTLRSTNQILTEHLACSKSKLFEALNQNTHLRSELKMAHKCIEHETGEPLRGALSSTTKTNWRGRAQQISLLKTKVADLKRQLNANNSKECEPTSLDLGKVESQRRLELERTNRRLTNVQTENEDQRKRLNAQRLRNTNLQEEICDLKTKIVRMSEIHAEDEERFNELHDTITANQIKYNEQLDSLNRQLSDKQSEVDHLAFALEESKCSLVDSMELVAKKGLEIDEFRDRMKATEDQLHSVCGDFLFKCRDLKKDEYMAILDVLEFEKTNLLTQVQTLNQRLVEERLKSDSHSELIRKLNIKNFRIEFKNTEILKELDHIKKRNSRSQRIADYVRSSTCVTTPATIPMHRDTKSSLSLHSHRGQESNFQVNYQIAELQNKFGFATERIRLLEENIKNILDEKTKDAETFTSIIAKSKFAIRDQLLARQLSSTNLDNERTLADFQTCQAGTDLAPPSIVSSNVSVN